MKLNLRLTFSSSMRKLSISNCVFKTFNSLAEQNMAINLGAGTPSDCAPSFVAEALKRYYGCPSLGQPQPGMVAYRVEPSGFCSQLILNETIASIYSEKMGRRLHPSRNVLVTEGAREAIHSTLNALLTKGDQAIVFDPSYQIYRGAIQKAGARAVGVPLLSRRKRNKLQLMNATKNLSSSHEDKWDLDFELLDRSITPQTKIVMVNSPHNPTGKIFTDHEMDQLAQILRKHKQITIVDDRVYEHTHFDSYADRDVPRISSYSDLFGRTVTIYSAGKLLRTPNLMCGWMIAPRVLSEKINKKLNISVDMGIQRAVAESLKHIFHPRSTFLNSFSQVLKKRRKMLIQQLLASKYDFNLWVPEAGFFVLADISNIHIGDQDHYSQQFVQKLPKDYAFCTKLCRQDGVAAIPCSSFFGQNHPNHNLVRFAFCKDLISIMEAGRRLREQQSDEEVYEETYLAGS